jgi:hypothetical protein
MSLIDAKYIEKAPYGRHGARYREKHTPEGRPYMWMEITYSDVPSPSCSVCGHSPFFRKVGEECPKCGGRLE